MKVLFTRSVLIAGEHQEEGSTAEVSDATATLLFAQGAVIAAPEQEAEAEQPKKGKAK
jgi:hypothetical protein